LATFTPEGLIDERILALASRVEFITDETARGPESASSGGLEIKTRTSTWSRSVAYPFGSPQRPMSSEQLTGKFLDCARLATVAPSEDSLRRIVDRVMHLEEVDDVGATIMDLIGER
jgi:2-methylcitrate dehydratase PrpD